MKVSDRVWRAVLYLAAAIALGLGMVEAVREAKLGTALSAGAPAPEFAASRMEDGQPFALTELRGKVVLLSFWASWCGPCRREMPILQKLEAQYRDQGLSLVTANMDDPDARAEVVPAFLEKLGGAPPRVVYPSDQTGRDWHAGTLPTLYVLGRQGQLLLGHSGSMTEGELRAQIEAALRAP